jgi:hypothetical protein
VLGDGRQRAQYQGARQGIAAAIWQGRGELEHEQVRQQHNAAEPQQRWARCGRQCLFHVNSGVLRVVEQV